MLQATSISMTSPLLCGQQPLGEPGLQVGGSQWVGFQVGGSQWVELQVGGSQWVGL